ncbi:transposase [Tranquillimonas alkanivorans]|uniref:Transposase n=1 Tax=Tranquillimonas alkanivorans TaxID=441119 RepID=A0A1I5TWR3_9RHOB|nr:transposase [Tranquillimonas alkanivorans]SFP86756.1 Transposase [Tranquillimonas alkanivorans]
MANPAAQPTLPPVFPIKHSRQGAQSPVSVADKLALFRYGYQHRLTQAELAKLAGVSGTTVANWRKQIEREKGRTANKLDQRRLAVVGPKQPSLIEGLDELEADEDPVLAKSREMRAAESRPMKVATDRGLPRDKPPAQWSREEKQALMTRMAEEHLTDEDLARIAGTDISVISGWRRDLGYDRRRNAPSELSRGERIALLERQKEEGLTNARAAEIARVTPDTITQWRKELGFAGKQGGADRRRWTLNDKRAMLARVDAGDLTVKELAEEQGTTAGAVYQWRVAVKAADRAADKASRQTGALTRTETPAPHPVPDQAAPTETAPALRTMKMTRPDGMVIEVQVTAAEMAALLSA